MKASFLFALTFLLLFSCSKRKVEKVPGTYSGYYTFIHNRLDTDGDTVMMSFSEALKSEYVWEEGENMVFIRENCSFPVGEVEMEKNLQLHTSDASSSTDFTVYLRKNQIEFHERTERVEGDETILISIEFHGSK